MKQGENIGTISDSVIALLSKGEMVGFRSFSLFSAAGQILSHNDHFSRKTHISYGRATIGAQNEIF
jgi:hypothetical protein